MAQPIPKLLFRTWSTESHGTNSQILFKTGSQADVTPSVGPASISGFEEKLRAALLGKHMDDNPFIFFSSSLLFVLQLAARKKSQGESKIWITCVNTETATTGNGSPARVHSVDSLMTQYDVEIRNRSDTSLRQYPSEYVAIASLSPKAGSRCTLYDTLIPSGLFDLYPHLREINQRYNVKWYRAVKDLREFGFSTERPLTKEEIDVAARLALSFAACTPSDVGSEEIELHLMAWFLSFRKRSKDDAALVRWIDTHTSIELENDNQTTFSHATTDLDGVEVFQYKQLLRLLTGRSLLGSRVDSSSPINRAIITRQRVEWQVWRQESMDRHRANRAERSGGDTYHRRRRNDRPSSRERNSLSASQDGGQRNRSRSPARNERRKNRGYRRRDYNQ